MTSTQASNRPVSVNLEGDASHSGDTSYIAIVDKDRNVSLACTAAGARAS
jgi:hypothetical protein